MAGSLEKVSILILDDSMHIRRLVNTMLRAMGATQIYEAKDTIKAFEILHRHEIDLALIDWMLDDGTGRTGLDIVQQIRQSPLERLAYLPIIMMTGHTERDNIEHARDSGITEFLAKPFTARGLHQRLTTLIDHPRPFVKTRNFFGPDRRRRSDGPSEEGERRFVSPRREQAR